MRALTVRNIRRHVSHCASRCLSTSSVRMSGERIEARQSNGEPASGTSNAAQPSTSTKSVLPSFPVSGVVGIVKPSGPTSMSLLDDLKPLLSSSSVFRVVEAENKGGKNRKKRKWAGSAGIGTPKIGQGGTLDPLADGVLVIGIGSGTKRLQQFIECSKEYRTVGLLGSSTLSYDSKDPILQRKPFVHVTEQDVGKAVLTFQGKLQQLPPLYSSIQVDGKRLFDYAREGKDLPRPVEKRAVEVHDICLKEWLKGGEHAFAHPEQECTPEEQKLAMRARRLAGLEATEDVKAGEETAAEEDGKLSPAFVLDMTVSSGTYVRSIVHDLGAKVGSAAHVVKLTRIRQGQWVLPGYDGLGEHQGTREAVPWEVLQRAVDKHKAQRKRGRREDEGEAPAPAEEGKESVDENGLQEWERILLDKMEIC